MVAMRNLLSSLNNLTQSRLQASGRSRLTDGAPVPGNAPAADALAAPWWDGEYVEGGVEPPLDEVLDDPVIHLMMRADHLEPEQVRRLLTSRQGQAGL